MISTGWSKNIGMDEDTYRVEQEQEGMRITTGRSKNLGSDEDNWRGEQDYLGRLRVATLVPTGGSKKI